VLYPAIIAAILLTLTLLLHWVTRRQVRRLGDEVERQRRLLEVLDERQRGPPPPVQPRPITARYTPRGTSRLADPSPTANQRLPEPSPTANHRLPEPSPRAVTRLADPSPRSSPIPADPSPRGTPRQPADPSPRGSPKVADASDWTPTHRITFTPEQGRPESWLVMLKGKPAGGKIAATKAEWSAAVETAWQCSAEGAWTYRGQRTPDGRKGAVKIEPFTP
jgi:hypothetical protein